MNLLKCVFCNHDISLKNSHNPAPFGEEGDRCCQDCNFNTVLPARIIDDNGADQFVNADREQTSKQDLFPKISEKEETIRQFQKHLMLRIALLFNHEFHQKCDKDWISDPLGKSLMMVSQGNHVWRSEDIKLLEAQLVILSHKIPSIKTDILNTVAGNLNPPLTQSYFLWLDEIEKVVQDSVNFILENNNI